MLIKSRPSWALSESDVTPESIYLNRRAFMTGAIASAAALALPGLAQGAALPVPGEALDFEKMPQYSTDEELTPESDVTQYNNFYEFGTGKGDPAKYADEMSVDPWSITVEGECDRPGPTTAGARRRLPP